jgi:hypothetical protein
MIMNGFIWSLNNRLLLSFMAYHRRESTGTAAEMNADLEFSRNLAFSCTVFLP